VDRFVGFPDVHGPRVCLTEHRNGSDSKLATSSNHTQRYFAAVSYQYLVERSSRHRGKLLANFIVEKRSTMLSQ
jgi:hypothetical protein